MMEAKALTAQDPVNASFSAAMARWVSSCMATHDIRYYLNGVNIEPVEGGGVLITATDGHRLLSAFDKDGTANQSFIFSFSREAIAACHKSLDGITLKPNARKKGSRITIEGTRLMVLSKIGEECYLQPGNCIVDGAFPDWRAEGRITRPPHRSDLAPAGDACMNFSYLAGFTKELPNDKFNLTGSVKMWRNKAMDGSPENSAVFLEFVSAPLLGVLMPRRDVPMKSHFFDRPAAGGTQA